MCFEVELAQRAGEIILAMKRVDAALYAIIESSKQLSELTPEARIEFEAKLVAVIRANTPVVVNPGAIMDLNSMYQAQYIHKQAAEAQNG